MFLRLLGNPQNFAVTVIMSITVTLMLFNFCTYIHTYIRDRSTCPEYSTVAYILLPIFLSPFFAIGFLLHYGVPRHAVFVEKEGNPFVRFVDTMKENRSTWTKYYGIGFFLAFRKARVEAREHSEWKVSECVCVCVCACVCACAH